MKKKRKVLCVLLAVVILAVATASIWAYRVAAVPRANSEFLTFQPFSGKLFDLDPNEINSIYIIPRTHQAYGSDINGKTYGEIICNMPEDVEKVTEILNAYRYFFWHPAKSPETGWGMTEPKIRVLFDNGETFEGFFSENRIWVSAYPFRADKLARSGAWYYGGRELYEALMLLQ